MGEMVKLIHRLAEIEEETLRSELGAIIRAERTVGPRYGARAAPEPPTPNKHTHEMGLGGAKQATVENPTTAPRLGTYASGYRCAAWQCCGGCPRVCCILVLVF